jgi:hypothetical protein
VRAERRCELLLYRAGVDEFDDHNQ